MENLTETLLALVGGALDLDMTDVIETLPRVTEEDLGLSVEDVLLGLADDARLLAGDM